MTDLFNLLRGSFLYFFDSGDVICYCRCLCGSALLLVCYSKDSAKIKIFLLKKISSTADTNCLAVYIDI